MTALSLSLVIFLAIAGPLAAVHMSRQRAELLVRLKERNNIVAQNLRDIQQAGDKITELSGQLATWNGRANPSEFWPPQRTQPVRQVMVDDLLNQSQKVFLNGLRAGSYDKETAARGYYSLAALADSSGKPSLAKEYYELAGNELQALAHQQPQDVRYSRALAECYTQLARLSEKSDREQSAKNFESARSIYEQIATDRKPDPARRIDWLESELNSATLAGFDSGQKHLGRADEIKNSLRGKWPKDPNALYRLSCYLTKREPILSTTEAETAQAADVAHPPTNPTNR
jgi:hypothetical protein